MIIRSIRLTPHLCCQVVVIYLVLLLMLCKQVFTKYGRLAMGGNVTIKPFQVSLETICCVQEIPWLAGLYGKGQFPRCWPGSRLPHLGWSASD